MILWDSLCDRRLVGSF